MGVLLCGCPHNNSPAIWGPYWGPGFLGSPILTVRSGPYPDLQNTQKKGSSTFALGSVPSLQVLCALPGLECESLFRSLSKLAADCDPKRALRADPTRSRTTVQVLLQLKYSEGPVRVPLWS